MYIDIQTHVYKHVYTYVHPCKHIYKHVYLIIHTYTYVFPNPIPVYATTHPHTSTSITNPTKYLITSLTYALTFAQFEDPDRAPPPPPP